MFHLNTSNRRLPVAAAVIASIASSYAVAGPISVNYQGSADFGSGQVGYASGSIAPNPGSSTTVVGVGVGGDSDTTTPSSFTNGAGQFNAWCVDIYHWLAGGTSTFNVETGASLATDLDALRPKATYGGGGVTPVDGAARVNDLLLLADDVYGTLGNGTLAAQQTASAAFQMAVWDITYGTADSSGNFAIGTSDAGFHVDAATWNANSGPNGYLTLANDWLAHLGPGSGNYTLTYLSDGVTGPNANDGSTQDLVAFTSVPEPATLALLGLGLLGVGAGRRRRR